MAGVAQTFTACLVNAGTPTNAVVVAAPAAGTSIVVQWVCVANGATAGEIKLLDGSGGTVKFSTYLAINTPTFVDMRRAPIVLTAATGLYCTGVTSTTSRVTVGYSLER